MKIIWSEENTFGEVLLRIRPGLSHANRQVLTTELHLQPMRVIRKQMVEDKQLSSGSLTETLEPRDGRRNVCV